MNAYELAQFQFTPLYNNALESYLEDQVDELVGLPLLYFMDAL